MDLCISVRRKCSPVHHLLEYIKEIRMQVDEGWKERERGESLWRKQWEKEQNVRRREERKESKRWKDKAKEIKWLRNFQRDMDRK